MEGSAEVVTDADDRFAYGIADGDEATAAEHERLSHLATLFDRGSIKLITAVGIAPGWHCLEVGAGHGGLARWLAEAVGDDGRVMATDIDTRFLVDMPSNVIVREHDIASDGLPAEHFDLVHARAVLQHVPEREHALQRMIDATEARWLDRRRGHRLVGVRQPRTARAVRDAASHSAQRVHRECRVRRRVGPADAGDDARRGIGRCRIARHGHDDARWNTERRVVRHGVGACRSGVWSMRLCSTRTVVDDAIAQARDPEFAVLSPLSISAWGQQAP